MSLAEINSMIWDLVLIVLGAGILITMVLPLIITAIATIEVYFSKDKYK